MTFRSAAKTIPSLASIPIAVPACEIASRAYSTWYKRPSGEKMVVYKIRISLDELDKKTDLITLESYLLDMMLELLQRIQEILTLG